ncbi:MAG: exonuclease SbcCD subunit D C-terminal domain-containing protein [Thermodesulfobacteriota bacterium]
MKLLHTSDWHLGHSLYGRKRYDEHTAFLAWLAAAIDQQGIDTLLVAGDIFDNSTPSNRAQELYYRFLCQVAASCCRHVVVIGGNHDSPSFLNAPRELLRALNVHVVGASSAEPGDEVIVLADSQGSPEAIVCAVPYLRDRDIRTAWAGESLEEKREKLSSGIRDHYAAVGAIAQQKRQELVGDLPIIATGHLFTSGGKTIDGDGVRDLYVGSLAQVGADTFPACIDYLALGHLHVPQQVGQAAHMRYSGSPIPCGFGEAKQEKKVVLVDFGSDAPHIEELAVPCFQPLARLSGSLAEIQAQIEFLKEQGSNAWLEIEYSGQEVIGNLRLLIDESVAGSGLEVRRIKNKQIVERVLGRLNEEESLEELDVNDVFKRCLDSFAVSPEERPALIAAHGEIVHDLLEEDKNAR